MNHVLNYCMCFAVLIVSFKNRGFEGILLSNL